VAKADGILDLTQLSDNLGGADEATLAEVTEFFVTSVQPLIIEAETHATTRRGADLQRVAHAAKGAARNVCAPLLAEPLAQLEAAAKASDWPAIDALMPEISAAFEQVVKRIGSAESGGAA